MSRCDCDPSVSKSHGVPGRKHNPRLTHPENRVLWAHQEPASECFSGDSVRTALRNPEIKS